MLIKIIGSVFILSASLMFYFEKRLIYSNNIKQADSYLKLLFHIKNKVSAYGMPMENIISSCDKEIIEGCGFNTTSGDKYISLYTHIQNANLNLDLDTMKIILDFANEFGGAYSSNLIKVCDYYIEVLRKRISDLKDIQGKNAKVHLALSLCITLSLVLILF